MTEYRANRKPAWQPTHPGALLRETVLPSLELTVKDAATMLGISRQALHNVLAEPAAVTPEMPVRIGQLGGNGAGLWLRMQQARDLWRVERSLAEVVKTITTLRAA